MKNIEYYKDEFTRLFNEMEIVHGRCESVGISHSGDVKNSLSETVFDNIVVNINF